MGLTERSKMINKKIIAFLMTLLLITGSNVNIAPSFATSGASGFEQIKVIVGFKAEIVSSQASKNASILNHGGQVRHNLKLINAISATMTAEAASKLAMDSTVAYVEPDYPVHSLGIGQIIPWGIEKSFGGEDYPFAIWNEASGAGISVAVLDTGINGNHEDLVLSNMGINCTSSGSFNIDVEGHGTHVAGTIAAQDNNFGVAGIAPQIILHSVKVLDDTGNGVISDVIEGIQWSVANNMKVINMSLGAASDSVGFEAACDAANAAGLLLVAAAGNSGVSMTTSGNILYPAKYDSVMAVSALNEDNDIASFSSTGPEMDIIAPGVNVLSAIPGIGGNTSVGGVSYLSSVLIGSTLGAIQAQMVDCGTALTEDGVYEAISNAGITGGPWIALIDRDNKGTFSLKVRNAMTYGASGAVIVNSDSTNPDDPGAFTLYATTSDEAVNWMPTVSVSTNSGVRIRDTIAVEDSSTQGSLVIRENVAYGYNSGTSMSAPHVAGVAALLWSANPELTNNQIRELISDTAIFLTLSDDTELNENYQGAGLLRGDLALTKLYISYPPAEVITLTLGGFTVASKIYDGTTNAITGAGFLDNRVSGDALIFSYDVDFNTKDVGLNKPVSFTNITISGADSYKYELDQTTGSAFANISQAALLVKANNVTKTIGSADPTFTATYTGFVPDESVSNLGGTLAFQRQAGEVVGNYTITPSGLTSSNYGITFSPGILTIQDNVVVVPDPPAGGGGGGAVGGGGAIAEPAVIIPIVSAPAVINSQLIMRFNIGVVNLYSISGSAIETVTLMDAAPFIFQGRTLLPVRFIVETLGGVISWDKDTQKVIIVKGNKTIELWIGSNQAKIDGVSTLIDINNTNVKPIIIAPGRTMLPVRFIAEALGCIVDWNQEKQEITIKYGGGINLQI